MGKLTVDKLIQLILSSTNRNVERRARKRLLQQLKKHTSLTKDNVELGEWGKIWTE